MSAGSRDQLLEPEPDKHG